MTNIVAPDSTQARSDGIRPVRRRLLRVIAGVSGVSGWASAHAQQWPDKPIRMIVTYPAGGGADAIARLVAPRLADELGQQVLVDNRPGASGQIAAGVVAKSPADGYTLMVDAMSFATNPSLFARLPYDPIKSFTPLTVVALFSNMLVVNPQFPVKDVAELIQLARARPGTLAYASSGNGSAQHLAGELFAQRLGLDLLHVPYKGGGPALTDVIGGQVPMFFANVASGLPHVRSGKLRILGVTGARRVAVLPQVPTLQEAGVADYQVYEWNAVYAPAGLPPPVLERLTVGLQKVLALPDIKERVLALGGELVASSPQDSARFVDQQIGQWAGVIRAGNIKPD